MQRRSSSALREAIEALLIAVIFMNFARVFVFQAFKIPSESMEQTLIVGDHLIVNKFVFGANRDGDHRLPYAEIERGDLVVFRYPEDPDVDFVKRVIALPGETIEIANKRVWIDGRTLDEPYLDQRKDTRRMLQRDDFGPLTLAEDEFFVMGDNRDESNDSRYWGPVQRNLIVGKPWIIYWSFEGDPPPEGSPFSERLEELAFVATHFFTHTRWDRTMIAVPSEKPELSFIE